MTTYNISKNGRGWTLSNGRVGNIATYPRKGAAILTARLLAGFRGKVVVK